MPGFTVSTSCHALARSSAHGLQPAPCAIPREKRARRCDTDSPIAARPSLIQHVAENKPGKARMKLTLVGSRYFGAAALERLLKEGIEIARVIVPAADDRLGVAAKAAGLETFVLDDPSIVPAEAIADGTDPVEAAHRQAPV